MADKISVMITEEQIDEKVRELAAQISNDYEGKNLHLLCVLKGSMFFTCELAKRLTVPVTIDTMSVSSYGAGTESSGRVRIIKDLDESIEDRDVMIVEDIIDSGITLKYLLGLLGSRNPRSLKLCTLLSKPERRQVEIDVDYIGMEIPDKFVVGFGLDYAQKYRNLPYIGVIEELDTEA